MSNLQRSIRHKRFKVKKGAGLKLHFDTSFGNSLEIQVKDCSLSGLAGTGTINGENTQWLNDGEIISAAKLTWEGHEISLGRLALRRFDPVAPSEGEKQAETVYRLAFSTVDIKIPLDGSLSKLLEIVFDHDTSTESLELSSDKFSLAHFVENDFTNVDLFNRIREFAIFNRDWMKSDKYAYHQIRMKSKGPRVNLKRVRRSGRSDYIMMGSNDYLGLGAHPEVVEAAKNAMDIYGFGATGSPVTTGLTDLHLQLCEKIAKIHNKEAAVLFNSGYTANVGIISSLCNVNDLVIADQLCHASIQDGIRMAKGTSRFFKHNNVSSLRQLLEKERGNFNGCLVITEGVFSMDGDVAPVDQIYQVARDFNCRVMVDQAHDFGVLGPNGLGVCDKYGLLKEVDIIMGTFSKIAGSIGGFATGSQDLIDWLRSFARSQLFTVSLPPSAVAAASKSLDIFLSDRSLLENLRRNIKVFCDGLRNIGCVIDFKHESAVVPVVVGDEKVMGAMYQSLLEDGIWCTPVVYPAVSRSNCRFRFTVMANHTVADLDYAVTCLEKAAIKSGFSFAKKQEDDQLKKVA